MAKTALCIGINDYPGTDSDLAGCVNDAHDWGRVLEARGFTVTSLLDRRATGTAMRQALQALVEGARTGDTVVIQYPGHGSFVPDRDGDEADGVDECLCPHDIEANGPITDDELFGILSSAARGARVVVISDSCHSGTVARFNPIATPASTRGVHAPRRTVRFLAPQAFLAPAQVARLGRDMPAPRPRGARIHAALLMAGCQDAEYSYDAFFEGRPNGAFTFVALRELETLGPGATYADWHTRVRTVLPSRQYPQRPDLVGTKAMKNWRVLE